MLKSANLLHKWGLGDSQLNSTKIALNSDIFVQSATFFFILKAYEQGVHLCTLRTELHTPLASDFGLYIT